MNFAESQWLWSLLAIPLIYLGARWHEHARKEAFARFAHPSLWQTIAPEAQWRSRTIKTRLLLLALAFAILALARPQWGTREETVRVSGMDIVVALDVSNSMLVEDVVPSRLQKAKRIIRLFTESLRGDRVGLVAFAGSSYMACPLTNDLEYLLQTLSLLSPKSVSGQGTDLGAALDTARKALERGAEDTELASPDEATRVVLLISDGEDHEDQAEQAAKELAKAGIRLFVLGIGSEKGGPIPLRDERGNLLGYKKTRSGEPLLSSFQPPSLMKLAQAAGGKYWNATTSESEVDELLAELNVLDRRDYAERTQLIYQDRFQYPLAVAVLLLLIELAVPRRRAIATAGLLWGLFMLWSQPLAQPAHAADKPPSAPFGAYLENEKGLQAYSEGKTEQARKHFGSAQALDPKNAALRYNQGVIQLQEGDIENGIRALDGAAQAAIETGDPRLLGLLGNARFNQGAALAKAGNLPDAVRAYLDAIDAARKSGDKTLEGDARKNLELLARQQQENKKNQKEQEKKEKQEQQKQEEQKKEEQKDEQEQQHKEDGDQKKDQKKDQKDGKEETDSEPQRLQENPKEMRQKQFKSVKLSEEDAERVMAELKNRERELQRRLKKQDGPQQRNAKDW